MTDEQLMVLNNAGLNTAEVLERIGGSHEIFLKFIKKFLDEPNYGLLKDAIEKGDVEKAFIAGHTFKGICSNLSLENLCKTVSEQVEFLRAKNIDEAKKLMPEITELYNSIIIAIKIVTML